MRRFGQIRAGAMPGVFLIPAALTVACAGGGSAPPAAEIRFTDAWTTGRLEEAIEVFESDTSLVRNPALAFRAGLAYAHPANPARDPRRARDLLRIVAESDTTGVLARDAETVLSLLDREREQRLRSDALRRELDALKAIDLEGPEAPAADSAGAGHP